MQAEKVNSREEDGGNSGQQAEVVGGEYVAGKPNVKLDEVVEGGGRSMSKEVGGSSTSEKVRRLP